MGDLPHRWLGAESCLSHSFPIKAGTTLWIHTEEASSSYRLTHVFSRLESGFRSPNPGALASVTPWGRDTLRAAVPCPGTAGGLSMLGCSPGPLSGAFPNQGRFSRWMADSLIDLTWAGSHSVVDLLGCSVLDEKELRSSPLEVHWIRWEDD